jgi:hypothetical protein
MKRYLILKDLITQASILTRANKEYQGKITGILYHCTPNKSKEVIDFIEEFGYAIVTVRGDVVLTISKLEEEQ